MGTMKKGILVLDPRTKILLLLGINIYAVSYTHLDVYKRQAENGNPKLTLLSCILISNVV